MLLKEAEKPRNEQRIKVDLFLEVYKSLHTIERYTPEVLDEISPSKFVDVMVRKYVDGVVDNVVGYRELSKIARSERAGISREDAVPVILRLVKDKKYSIEQAYEDTVQVAYEQRDLATKLRGVTERLARYKSLKQLNQELVSALNDLRTEVWRLLGKNNQ